MPDDNPTMDAKSDVNTDSANAPQDQTSGNDHPAEGQAADPDPSPTTGTSNSSNPFTEVDPIFANKELLEISHLPDRNRIIGRDEEIDRLASAINPAIFGQSPSNVLIYGKTGTGKSLCAKYLSRKLIETGKQNDVNVGRAYIDCSQDNTETQAVQSIASTLNSPAQTDFSIPRTGISTSAYYKYLWEVLDTCYDIALIILDEIDRLKTDDILLQLSRAGEAEKVDNCKIGVIGISNKVRYKERMSERVKSSLCEREFVFPPYDALQLEAIMKARQAAFHDGVLNSDVIPLTASLAAREHGDARKAIDILRYAGELAQMNRSDTVYKSFVKEARQRAETDRFKQLIEGLTPHARYTLQALTILSLNDNSDPNGFRTTDIYKMYCEISRQFDSNTLSNRRIRDLLEELAFLGITEQEKQHEGRAQGNYLQHQLLEDPNVIQDILTSVNGENHN